MIRLRVDRSAAAVALLLGLGLVMGLALPPFASAHAVITSTEPSRGAALTRSPERVVFRFNEAVESSFGAVRVLDSKGRRVDDGRIERPSSSSVAVGVKDDLPDGPYTAAYRVVSGDAHPVSGGFVFTVGESGGAPASAVEDAIGGDAAGQGVTLALGAVRALAYLATALLVGGALFVAFVWAGALRTAGGAGDGWRRASQAFVAHARRAGVWVAALGVVCCATGIVLQGAVAGGTSLAAALQLSVLGEVLGTRFGSVWTLRLLAFTALGALILLPAARTAAPAMRPAHLGATGLAPAATPRTAIAVAAVPLAVLVVAPALSGHAAAAGGLVLVPANIAHVAAMSAWVGGLALLLFALPAATRRLEPRERSSLVAAAVTRFSGVALIAVGVLLASGVLQSVVHLESLGDLTGSAFGRAILVKSALFMGLVGLGAYNRQRLRPRLKAIVAAGKPPARAGLILRRALRAEIVLMVAAIGATGALTSYSPTAGAATGPFSAVRDLGPARLELTVEPARVGSNEAHLYLFDRRDGRQYDRAKEIRVLASLPASKVGPLQLRARKTGPGHYTLPAAQLVPAGDWMLEVRIIVTEFDSFETEVEVPVR